MCLPLQFHSRFGLASSHERSRGFRVDRFKVSDETMARAKEIQDDWDQKKQGAKGPKPTEPDGAVRSLCGQRRAVHVELWRPLLVGRC